MDDIIGKHKVQEAFNRYATAAQQAEERNTLRRELTHRAAELRAAGDTAGARLARAQRNSSATSNPSPGRSLSTASAPACAPHSTVHASATRR
jgi:hypothetical protein